MASRVNLIIEQYVTFEHTVNWADSSGNPIDLTGFRIRLQVRQTFTSPTKLLDFDSDSLGAGMHITTLGPSGSFTITLDPSVTSTLSFNSAEYDLVAISPGGVVYRLHEGKASVSLGVTR